MAGSAGTMSRDCTVPQLRTFLKVAELGSLSRAAVALTTPQPAVSRMMSRIEQSVGVTLLERRASGVSLTAAGERFAEHARASVKHHDLAREEAQALGGVLRGEVRIATPESVGDLVFVPLVRHFREKHPATSVRVMVATSSSIPGLIDNRMIDVGVIADTHPASGLVGDPLCREDFYLVGPAGARALAASTIRLARAARLPLVLNAMPGGLRTRIDEAFAARKIAPSIRFEIDATDPLLDLLVDGEGYSILPFSTIAKKSQCARLGVARIVAPAIYRRLLLVLGPARTSSSLCREVARQLRRIVHEVAPAARWKETGEVRGTRSVQGEVQS